MDYLLFFLYLLLGWVVVIRSGFVRNSDLSKVSITALYLLKVAAGVALGYISFTWYPQGSDYAMIHREGIINYEMLKKDPSAFIRDLFYSPYGHYDAYFESVGSYWTDLRNNLIIKTVAILNLITGGNYYTNSIFFNVAGFFGCVALYRTFKRFYNENKAAIIFAAFLIPSTLYFSSGIHKDALVFISVSLLSYALLHEQKLNRNKWIVIIFSFLTLLFIRNYVAAFFLPAFIAYRYTLQYGVRKSYFIVYACLLVMLFGLQFSNTFSITEIIFKKQQAFLYLPKATSQIPIDTLQNTTTSLLKATPQALNNLLTQPRPWEHQSFLFFAGLEWYFYLLLMLIGIAYWKSVRKQTNLILCCFLFVIPVLLLSGWTVPNAGSLIRYKALYLPWLLLPFLCIFQTKLKHIIYKNI